MDKNPEGIAVKISKAKSMHMICFLSYDEKVKQYLPQSNPNGLDPRNTDSDFSPTPIDYGPIIKNPIIKDPIITDPRNPIDQNSSTQTAPEDDYNREFDLNYLNRYNWNLITLEPSMEPDYYDESLLGADSTSESESNVFSTSSTTQ